MDHVQSRATKLSQHLLDFICEPFLLAELPMLLPQIPQLPLGSLLARLTLNTQQSTTRATLGKKKGNVNVNANVCK